MGKNSSKRWYSFLFSLFFAISISSCRTVSEGMNAAAPGADADTLRVGVSTNAPPIIFKQNGKITGLEAAFAQKLGLFLNKKIIFVEVPWVKQIEYLNQGKTDIIMSGMTITPQRKYQVDFITPYLRSGQIMLVRLEDRRKFSNGITDVMNKNYRVGTVSDTTGDFFVTEALTKVNEINFKTSRKGVEALINKNIDVLVYDAPMVCHYAAVNQSEKLVPILVMATEEYLSWAVRKNDADLKERLNLFMKTINDNGELKKEINNWIPYLNG
jgi:ABC-type amino acid transport substrate-binding protein